MLNKTEQKVLKYLLNAINRNDYKYCDYTNKQIADKLKLSSVYINKIINGLKNKNLIKISGNTKSRILHVLDITEIQLLQHSNINEIQHRYDNDTTLIQHRYDNDTTLIQSTPTDPENTGTPDPLFNINNKSKSKTNTNKKEKNIKKEKEFLDFSQVPEEILQDILDFAEMRSGIKKPLTQRGLNMSLRALKPFSIEEQKDLISRAIDRRYQGIVFESDRPKEKSFADQACALIQQEPVLTIEQRMQRAKAAMMQEMLDKEKKREILNPANREEIANARP